MNKKLALFLACCMTCGFAACDDSDDNSDSSGCNSGEKICKQGSVLECDANGEYHVKETCEGDTPICDETEHVCKASENQGCQNGTKRCAEGNVLEICEAGEWITSENCPEICGLDENLTAACTARPCQDGTRICSEDAEHILVCSKGKFIPASTGDCISGQKCSVESEDEGPVCKSEYKSIRAIHDDFDSIVDSATCNNTTSAETVIAADVAVKGVITGIRSNGSGFFIQEASNTGKYAGMFVSCKSFNCTEGLTVGNAVKVTSTGVGQLKCRLQIRALNADNADSEKAELKISKLASGTLPEITPKVVSVDTINTADELHNPYNYTLVKLDYVKAVNFSSSKWIVADENNNKISLRTNLIDVVKTTLVKDFTYDIVGIAGYFNENVLYPRDIAENPPGQTCTADVCQDNQFRTCQEDGKLSKAVYCFNDAHASLTLSCKSPSECADELKCESGYHVKDNKCKEDCVPVCSNGSIQNCRESGTLAVAVPCFDDAHTDLDRACKSDSACADSLVCTAGYAPQNGRCYEECSGSGIVCSSDKKSSFTCSGGIISGTKTTCASTCLAGTGCVDCLSTNDCASNTNGKKSCDTSAHACVECLSDNDCASNTNGKTVCDTTGHICVGTCTGSSKTCVDSSTLSTCSGAGTLPVVKNCTGTTPVCKNNVGCVQCTSHSHCTNPDKPYCTTSYTCVEREISECNFMFYDTTTSTAYGRVLAKSGDSYKAQLVCINVQAFASGNTTLIRVNGTENTNCESCGPNKEYKVTLTSDNFDPGLYYCGFVFMKTGSNQGWYACGSVDEGQGWETPKLVNTNSSTDMARTLMGYKRDITFTGTP